MSAQFPTPFTSHTQKYQKLITTFISKIDMNRSTDLVRKHLDLNPSGKSKYKNDESEIKNPSITGICKKCIFEDIEQRIIPDLKRIGSKFT